jgi:hypothetical protein
MEEFLVRERQEKPVLPYLLCISVSNERESLVFSIAYSPFDLQTIDDCLLFIAI